VWSIPGRSLWLLALSLVALLVWDASGLDLALAQWFGGPGGFPLRDSWLLSQALHGALRVAAWIFSLVLCANVVWPVGFMSGLKLARRVQLPASALLATGVIATLKVLSSTSCPWDLAQFGGVAQYVSHWQGWTTTDGGGGHCFPAGHAASGFAFVGGFFALRADRPRAARAWLIGSLVTGFVAGATQQLRGAHFMSHTLWTAWICWAVGALTDSLFTKNEEAPATLLIQ